MGVHWRGTGGWGDAGHRGYSHRVSRLLQVQTQVRGHPGQGYISFYISQCSTDCTRY